jgi:hypothetical protein
MKKILATVSAVVLSLAMVAMPSVAATAVPPDDVGQDTCDKLGYNKPAALDASSGNVDIYDGLVLIGNLTWSGASVSYDLEPGWTIDICIKSGAQTGGGDKITEFSDLVGSGATPAIEQNISHIGYTATFTRTELITATPDATFVDESCDVESEVLTKGVITVDLSVVGVTYTITQGGNPVAFDAVTGKTGPLTAGLTYIVTASANTGHKLSGPYEEQFTPFSAAIDCETLPGVTPFASQDPGCELPSFFTIGNTLADPTALSWTANGNPIAEGKHVVNGATTITVAATANPGYGIEGDPQTEWTFTFPAKETCDDLDTLALTGASDTTPALALTAFLGLLGLAMVRSGIRVNRIRQEA